MGATFSHREPRSSGMRVRLTPSERRTLDELAEAANVQRSDVIRLGLVLVLALPVSERLRALKGGAE